MNKKGFVSIVLVIVVVVVIGVVGYLALRKSPEMAPLPITQTAPVQTANDVPSDWKTYSNAEHGLSFQYSSSFSESEPSGVIVYLVKLPPLPGDMPLANFSIRVRDKPLDIDMFAQSKQFIKTILTKEIKGFGEITTEIKTVTFSGITGLEFAHASELGTFIFLPKKDLVYIINYSSIEEEQSNITKILSTLKFSN